MARLRRNILTNVLATDLLIGDVSIDFASPLQEGGVNISTITAPDIMALRIGTEVMHLTAYTSGATSGTVLRGQEDTAEADHFTGDAVGNVITKEDFADSGGGGDFIVRVAASDAPAEQQAVAMFVADGSNDEVTLDAAIDYIDGLLSGTSLRGVIELSAGTFFFGAVLSITSTTPLLIRGYGGRQPQSQFTSAGTFIEKNVAGNFSSISVATASPVEIEAVQFYPSTSENIASACLAVTTTGAELALTDVQIFQYGTDGPAISVTGTASKLTLTDCHVEADEQCVLTTGITLSVTAERSVFYCDDNTLYAIDCTAMTNDSHLIMRDCWRGGVGPTRWDMASGTSGVLIDKCWLEGNGALNILELTDAPEVLVRNCKFWNVSGTGGTGLKLTNCSDAVVTGNFFLQMRHHGIWVLDADKVLIEGNLLDGYSEQTDNTYSGIILDGDTNDCLITGNLLRSTAANNGLYGIRIDDSTCDNNTITNNDVRSSCNTNGNEVSDVGTGTRGHEVLLVAIGDETTAITATGNPKTTMRMPYAFCLTRVRASLTTASSSGNPTFDINEGGTTVLSTKLSVDSGERTSTTAATPAVISDPYLADDAEITFDVDTAGTGAAGPKIALMGWRV